MAISVFDLFKIGIGPSSSHTVGPMRAASMFAQALQNDHMLAQVASVKCELYGSLGATGKGHGSDVAVMLGLMGHAPDTVDVEAVPILIAQARKTQSLSLLGGQVIPFREKEHLLMYRREAMAEHPNGMKFTAFSADGAVLRESKYLSVGGGFVVTAGAANEAVLAPLFRLLPGNWKSIHAHEVAQAMLSEALTPGREGVTILPSAKLREIAASEA